MKETWYFCSGDKPPKNATGLYHIVGKKDNAKGRHFESVF